jgi:hypothetical protein
VLKLFVMVIITDLLLWAGKTLAGKFLDRSLDRFKPGKLVFTKVTGIYRYSHYNGCNHVREGGEKRIYQAGISLSVFNPSRSGRIIRELTLYCVVDGMAHPFQLYDTTTQKRKENYQLPALSVSEFSWQAAPVGHGISIWLGAPGIIPFTDCDEIGLYLTYLDERGRHRRIELGSLSSWRLPKEQIAE